MGMKSSRLIQMTAIAAALFATAAFAGGSALAQGATPSAGIDMSSPHPEHIHNGTCAKLGSIAWPLNDAAAMGIGATMMGTPVSGTPMAAPMMMATPMAGMGPVVSEASTTVKVHLADLEKAPFAINAHESAAKITNYIACGEVTGTITGGMLTVQLKEQNKSGVAGVAMLKDNGDGTTTVNVQLMKVMP
jgi:hypothetical protein